MSLEVTKIEVRKYERDNLKGYVNITFNGELTIDGFKLMDGENGLWLAPPSRKTKDGWSNIIRFTKELQRDILDKVKNEFDKTDDNRSGDARASDYHNSPSRRR